MDRLRGVGLGGKGIEGRARGRSCLVRGALVPGAPPQPYLAPLTAMLTVQLTVAESLTSALHRTLGAFTLGLTPELGRANYEQSRAVVLEFEATRQAVQRAEQCLRFNVRASGERARLDAVRWHVEALARRVPPG